MTIYPPVVWLVSEHTTLSAAHYCFFFLKSRKINCQSDIRENHERVNGEAGFFFFLSKFLIQKDFTSNVKPLKHCILFVAEMQKCYVELYCCTVFSFGNIRHQIKEYCHEGIPASWRLDVTQTKQRNNIPLLPSYFSNSKVPSEGVHHDSWKLFHMQTVLWIFTSGKEPDAIFHLLHHTVGTGVLA